MVSGCHAARISARQRAVFPRRAELGPSNGPNWGHGVEANWGRAFRPIRVIALSRGNVTAETAFPQGKILGERPRNRGRSPSERSVFCGVPNGASLHAFRWSPVTAGSGYGPSKQCYLLTVISGGWPQFVGQRRIGPVCSRKSLAALTFPPSGVGSWPRSCMLAARTGECNGIIRGALGPGRAMVHPGQLGRCPVEAHDPARWRAHQQNGS